MDSTGLGLALIEAAVAVVVVAGTKETLGLVGAWVEVELVARTE
jgi:hypothetical protein